MAQLLVALVEVFGAVCAGIFGLLYRRYLGILGILGVNRRVPTERQAYDGLWASLAEGNLAARPYVERLTRFLNWVDRFFGDAGMPDRTLFPHAFWLRTLAPLWTAPAFDRCLLLAFIYPIVTIFVIWAISGQVGQVEAALGLRPALSGWERALAGVAIGVAVFAMWRAIEERGLKRIAWGLPGYLVACAAGFSVAGAIGGALAAALLFCLAGVVASVSALATNGTGVVTLATAVIVAYGLTNSTVIGDIRVKIWFFPAIYCANCYD